MMISGARASWIGPTFLVGVSLVLFVGCDSGLGPFEPDNPLIQTDAQEYELELTGEEWLSAEIPYTFENRTGGTVYIPNCQGGFSLRLDRLEGFDWEPAWAPTLLACLSSPIVIEPGESFSQNLNVTGGLLGTNTGPRWDREDPSGIYRIVWVAALSSYDQDRSPFGPQIPLEYRVSNPFVLSR